MSSSASSAVEQPLRFFIFVLVLFSTFTIQLSNAETIVDPSSIKDVRLKSLIGQDFYVEKDHPYLSLQRTNFIFADSMASFLTSPDFESCSMVMKKCDAISFNKRTKFRIESVVIPDNVYSSFPNDLRCPQSAIQCFLRVTTEDNIIAFIRFLNFQNASKSANAIYLKYPGLLQIEPATVSSGMSPEKKAVQSYFKNKRGILIGYTANEVLSSWGKPDHKTKSVNAARSFQIWSYHNSMITFVDDVVTDITKTE